MTLLVGIHCDDGCVIAADQQATHGALGLATVGQAVTKTTIIADHSLYAFSGAVSMGQQFCTAMTDLHSQFKSKACNKLIPDIQAAIRKILTPAFDIANKTQPIVGQQGVHNDVVCTSLLGAHFQDGVHLLDISFNGTCEILSKQFVRFACHGSGKANADPILRFLWNVYWPKSYPTLQEAVLAAYWTVKIAIELKTPGVGFEPDVHVIEPTGRGDKTHARQVLAAELEQHDGFIDAVKQAMQGVVGKLRIGETPDAVPTAAAAVPAETEPEPPPLPSSSA
jgi:20S proteasome alpha/beta subunit